ncbi:TonB-dependent receptor [Coraliomargarita sp. SDUM461003]|uniref:TonB-dependent receptor n=1 Tax=Thalassobacterium maritimum TaxID=3041265 RepID=A0ABU1API0_9BACT|nr:TonB-dependent receptor [Coraliomargarita sp. SDUM461003]MDQ8206082.1 TonB-dependent receptor [Coraliomargarita sp. SDUM461003]
MLAIGEHTHFVLAGSWYQRNAIYARDRGISDNADRRAQGGQNQGSPTFPGRINYAGTEYILKDGVSAPASINDYRVFDSSEDLYNFSASAPSIPEIERKNVMAQISHQINPAIEVWSELLFTRSQFNNGLAPAPWSSSAYNPGILNAAKNSPYRPADIDPNNLSQLNYRSFELGNLEYKQAKDAFRGLLGLRGDIEEWNWETALLYIRTEQDDHYSGIADSDTVISAINDGSFNPFANAFATGTGYDNAAALQAAERHPVNEFDETFWTYDIKLAGSPFELDAGLIDVATGLEFRSEEIQVAIDDLFESGNNLGGIQAASFGAEREVAALYLESNIPLVQQGSHSLDLQLSGRYEAYHDQSTSAGAPANQYEAFVYKSSLFYEPNSALSFYLSYGTSFRAPTLTESYGGDQLASYIYDDPTGQTPAATRVYTFISGNPDLEPETSESVHLGFAYQPHPGRGWKLNLNYYHLRTEDSIVNSGQDVVNQNAGGALRDGNGKLILVYANWFNAAEVKTDGIDLTVSYTHPTTTGLLKAELGVNHVFNYDIKTTSNSPYVSYLGRLVDPRASNENIAGPGSIPEYKGYARFTWAHQQLTVAPDQYLNTRATHASLGHTSN